MSASVRQSHVSITVLLLFVCVASAYALPFSLSDDEGLHALAHRSAVITYDDSGHIANITNTETNQTVLQGAATDGSGVDFDASAIIWLALSFAAGVPLMLAGLALPRLTTGVGIGLAAIVCIWASFANTVNSRGVADLIITLICLGSFVIGFVIGLFEVGYHAGITMLAFLGGFSVGVRIVLFRPDLLVHDKFFGNWLIITGLGLLMFILLLLKSRAAVTIGSAAAGTFMTSLGIDLIIYKQSGLSMGLRYLFDRNSSHMEYILTRGWNPPIGTEVIMAVSLALIPPLAYAQHRIFKSPFKRVRTSSISTMASIESNTPSTETSTAKASLSAETSKLEKRQTVDLNVTTERLITTPTPNPSVNSLAKLLPQKPPNQTIETLD